MVLCGKAMGLLDMGETVLKKVAFGQRVERNEL